LGAPKLRTNTLEMISSQGYKIDRVLGESAKAFVYLATKQEQKFVLKISRENEDSDNECPRLIHEANQLVKVKSPFVEQLVGIEIYDKHPVLIKTYFPGQTLREWLNEHSAIDRSTLASEFLPKLLKQIAQAVADVHRAGVCHLDIKPENILINDSNKICLIDFDLSQSTRAGSTNKIFGTLEYSSPEQMQLTSAPIGPASDWYSVGCIVYEVLTGQKAFQNKTDLVYGIHRHANTSEKNLFDDAQTYGPIKDCVLACLKKDPKERHTAVHKVFQETGIYDYSATDSNEGVVRTKIIGRDAEIQRIRNWLKSDSSKSNMCQITGESGSGKTVLANLCLSDRNANSNHLLIGAKAEFDKTSAFSWIRSALLNLEGSTFANQILQNELTELNSVLKTSDSETITSRTEYSNRILKQLSAFVGKFELTIFYIDDIQWIDKPSWRILQNILTDSNASAKKVLTTLRDDSLSTKKVQGLLGEYPVPIGLEIVLNQLSGEDLSQLARSMLFEKPISKDLDKWITKNSLGNPFAAQQLLIGALDDGQIYPSQNGWELSDLTIDTNHHVHVSGPAPRHPLLAVIDKRLSKLSKEELTNLFLASLLGHTFDQTDLALFSKEFGVSNPNPVADQLFNLQRQKFIEAIDQSGNWAFSHDKIQEAILLKFEQPAFFEAQKKWVLYLLSRDCSSNDRSDKRIAEHAYHVVSHLEPVLAFQIMSKAAENAVHHFDFASAIKYFDAAEKLRVGNKLVATVGYFLDAGSAYCKVAQFDEAIEKFNCGLKLSPGKNEQARLHNLLAETHMAMCDFEKAHAEFLLALSSLNIKAPTGTILSVLKSVCIYFVGICFWTFGKHSDRASRPEHLLLLDIYDRGSLIGYFDVLGVRMLEYSLRGFYHAARTGPSEDTAIYFIKQYFMWVLFKLPNIAKYFYRHAMNMATELESPKVKQLARSYKIIAEYLGPEQKQVDLETLEFLNGPGSTLPIEDYVKTLGSFLWSQQLRGRAQEAIRLAEWGLERLNKHDLQTDGKSVVLPLAWIHMTLWCCHARLGNHKIAVQYLEAYKKSPARGRYQIIDALGYEIYLMEEIEDHSGRDAELVKLYARQQVHDILVPHYVRQALLFAARLSFKKYLAAIKTKNKTAAEQHKLEFKNRFRGLWYKADIPLFQAHYVMLMAYAAFLNERFWISGLLLNVCQRFAASLDAPSLFFDVQCLRYEISVAKNNRQEIYLQSALGIAKQFGWRHWVRKIESEILNKSESNGFTQAGSKSLQFNKGDMRADRFLAALTKICKTTITSFDLNKIIPIIHDQLIAILGAERSFLFMFDEAGTTLSGVSGRNANGEDLPQLTGFSRTIIQRVQETRQSVFLNASEQGEVNLSESVVTNNLRSIVCAPLLINDELKGVLYLDNSLVAGIFGADDLLILESLASQLMMFLEITKGYKAISEKHVLEKDLAIGSAIQKLMLPSLTTQNLHHFELAPFYRPASHCGGDWWWQKQKGEKLWVVVGDVTGHGAGPAMMTASIYSMFQFISESAVSLAQLLFDVQKEFRRQFPTAQHWMNVTACEMDSKANTLHVLTAGGPPVVVWNSTHKESNLVGERGDPIGSDSFEPGSISAEFPKGSSLCIFTDGIIETENSKQRPFGYKSFVQLVNDHSILGTEKLRDQIVSQVDLHRSANPQLDDYTLVCVRRKN
jgi:serine/threonine protein kinase